jgi:hypothetical protein
LNAIPVLSEFRDRPDDFFLLRVGYGGLMGAIANVTADGFPPAAFHAFPSTLRIDGITGDYGPGFLAHAINTATYVVRHPEFGWVAFGGALTVHGDAVRVRPQDSARSRVYLAPLGLWIVLDAGTISEVGLSEDGAVRVTLDPATPHTPTAFLRVEQPGKIAGGRRMAPVAAYEVARGAFVIPLGFDTTTVLLRENSGLAP